MPAISRREQLRRALDIVETPCVKSIKPEIPAHDPAAWREDFHRWALSNCVYKDRCFGGIGALHADFCRWATHHESVPMQRGTFEELLRSQDFLFAGGMVYGLILAADLSPEEARRLRPVEPGKPNGGLR